MVQRVALAVVALCAAALGGCFHRDDVMVRVIVAAHAGSGPVEDLRVFVGGSKSSWPTVSPGESVGVILSPEGEAPQVIMNYRFAGTTRNWEGPKMPEGFGYAVAITIGAGGIATETHGAMPRAL